MSLTRQMLQDSIRAQLIAGGVAPDPNLYRADANESIFFARSLEDIATETYDVEYPELQGRSLCPVYTKISTGAEYHTWRQYDLVGDAAEITDYGDDFPGVEISGAEFTSKIIALGDSYGYSVQDLRNAAFANVPLDSMKAKAARDVIERKLDAVLATGSVNRAKNLVYGMLNNPNVTIVNPAISAGSGTPYVWHTAGVQSTKTVKEIVKDVTTWFTKVRVDTNDVHSADTLIVDVATDAFLNSTYVNRDDSTIYTGLTLKNFLLALVPGLKQIRVWNRANVASAGGGGAAGAAGKARFMVYESSKPANLSALIPQEFEQFAPQLKNMKFITNCHMRTGGVIVRYPKSALYVDGCTG